MQPSMPQQAPPGRGQVRRRAVSGARRLLGLELVRRDDRDAAGRAGSAAPSGPRAPGLGAGAPSATTSRITRGRDDALAVVGDDDGTAARRRARGSGRGCRALEALRDVVGLLAVGPHDLLVVGDDPRLDRRGAAGSVATASAASTPAVASSSRDALRRRVASDDARQDRRAAQGADVARHVAGAPDVEALAR